MTLTSDQQKLCDALKDLVDIDLELDEIRSKEDTLNLRRHTLARERTDSEKTLKAAYARGGYPTVSVALNGRMVTYDSRIGILSLRAITPTCFALLVSPNPNLEPAEPESLVAPSHCVTLGAPKFSEEEA